MFGFGNKKSRLETRYQNLLEEAFRLSHSNRKLSDEKHAEANAVLQEIQELEKADCDQC